MGKSRTKNAILIMLPRATTSNVTNFLSPPPSPVRVNSSTTKRSCSLVPREARRKPRAASFDLREPMSPKVSCIGQVKRSKKKNRALAVDNPHPEEEEQQHMSLREAIIGIFKRKQHDHVKPELTGAETTEAAAVPSLGHMKSYASGRGGALHNFDWARES